MTDVALQRRGHPASTEGVPFLRLLGAACSPAKHGAGAAGAFDTADEPTLLGPLGHDAVHILPDL